ncbi:MAG: oxygen-insensitive NADPH nitroreductase [Ectothiorhodospiraceae bacterium]|nr:oxygen-insensitive NADPH nitroreductase [Ectothiorhodospiraceae bacterium]
MNPVIDLLKSHRSIRKFTDRKIDEELFQELIRAGQSAATSSHVQATTVIRVNDPGNRQRIAELAGNQPYVVSCSHFLMFCADMRRIFDACKRSGTEVKEGMTEQFVIATVDTALMAQNVAVAAESAGLGICYIGGVRNNPAEISELLRLPRHVYPVFGFCMGYPDQSPEVKPRLPLPAILKDDYYDDSVDQEQVSSFDETMRQYYRSRSSANKDSTWTEQMTVLFTSKSRPHMRDFLRERGFEMK